MSRSLTYSIHHEIFGGSYLLHPSETLANKDIINIDWTVQSLGLKPLVYQQNAIYPLKIVSKLNDPKNIYSDWEIDLTLETYYFSDSDTNIPEPPVTTNTYTLSKTNNVIDLSIPQCRFFRIKLTNKKNYNITDCTIVPVFI